MAIDEETLNRRNRGRDTDRRNGPPRRYDRHAGHPRSHTMNARTDTTPAPIRDGRAHDLTAWEEYWDTHGYTPVGLDESQASGKAVELSHKASKILEREQLGMQGAHAPIEMRRWGEEVCITADAPNGSQCVIWLDVESTDPNDLEAIVAENLLCWEPATPGAYDEDDETYFHEAGQCMLEHQGQPTDDGTADYTFTLTLPPKGAIR